MIHELYAWEPWWSAGFLMVCLDKVLAETEEVIF